MAGLLFVFILMVAAFAIQLTEQQEKIEEEKMKTATDRTSLLNELKESFDKDSLHVTIDYSQGVLHLGERAIRFPEGKDEPDGASLNNIRKVAKTLSIVLPKYTHSHGDGSRKYIDALFIEGHTDVKQITNTRRFSDNWVLSVMRSIRVYNLLTDLYPGLDKLINTNGNNILCVSGYSDSRPISTPKSGKEWTDSLRAPNRRIDLRFLMESPFDADLDGGPGIEIKQILEANR
jgi:flagellar motor protein MotB